MGTIQIKKINGNEYGYDFFSYWDKKEKKTKKKSKYLGKVIDKEKGIFEKKKEQKKLMNIEDKILDFGNSYMILEFLKTLPFYEVLTKTFKDDLENVLALTLYVIINNTAMNYADIWLEGDYLSIALKKVNISSQRISEFFMKIGKESTHRRFFKNYLSTLSGKTISTLIDSTGLPNSINYDLKAWSNHGGNFEEETRLLYVIDRKTGMPTYFRYMAGNIVDVTTLTNTIEELKQYNVRIDYSIIDAGYYSEDNIKVLYDEKVKFLTRLPSNRKLYKELIKKYGRALEEKGDIVTYGKRTLFIKEEKVKLYDRDAYAYLIYDIKRSSDEANKYILSSKADGLSDKEIREGLLNKGKLILISSEKIELDKVVPLYYTRQKVENIFGVLKSEINILPLRVHNEKTFRGYILLNFIAVIVELSIQKQLQQKYTVDEFLMISKNLKCKVFEKDILINEPNKNMKEIMELLNVTYKNKLPR